MKPVTPKPFITSTLLYFILLLSLLTFSCAYYNTFYNAQRFYRQAEKERLRTAEKTPSRSTLALYDKAIQKASKLLVLYPKSRWVDDSLLLLGKAFYWKGEYSKAARKFAELEANYPKSNLVNQARWWRGICLWKMKSYSQATETLQTLALGKDKLSGKALLALAQIFFEQKKYMKTVEILQEARRRIPDQKELAKIYYLTGESYLALKEYPQAVGAFRKAMQLRSNPEMEFKSNFKIGQCLEESGQPEKALEIYNQLLKDERYHSHAAELNLQIARCYRLLGNFSRALSKYRKVTEEYPQDKCAINALYEAGIIYQSRLDSLDRAQECFKKVEKANCCPQLAHLAQLRNANIEKLKKYRAAANSSPDTLFLLAELYLFEFSQPDSALAEYRKVEKGFPESPLAPKALYSIGWVYKNSLQDTLRANQTFRRLLERHPRSQYAYAALKELGLEDPGKELFSQIEKMRLNGAPPEVYLPKLEQIIEKHPGSPYAPKAEYLIAWTYEHVLRDSLRAYQAYQELARRFPDTKLGHIASEKLASGKKSKEKSTAAQEETLTPQDIDENSLRTRRDIIKP